MKPIKAFLLPALFSFIFSVSNAQMWHPAGNYVWHGPVAVVYSDSLSGHLIVGGLFDSIGNVPANNIAEWDGNSWQPLGNGLNDQVEAITVFNGSVYASTFNQTEYKIYRWNGFAWSVFGAPDYHVQVLKTHNNKLYAGGDFYSINGVVLNGLGVWDGSSWNSVGGGIPSQNGGGFLP